MSIFAKNLYYPEILAGGFKAASKIAPMLGQLGYQAFTELFLMHIHHEEGMTFVVQKAVTDDLELTDFIEPHFENLPWPARTIEFNFEDPALSTVLIGHLKRTEMVEIADKLNVTLFGHAALDTHQHELIALAHCADGSGSAILIHDEDTWTRLLAGERHDIVPSGPYDGKLPPHEADALVKLVLLCFKVLAYSSIPQYKPQPVTRGQLKRGEAKPGVKGRPTRPTFRIVYLPHVVHTAPPGESIKTSGAHVFKGRRGHIRWFLSDYFVNKKGQWTYIAPIVVEGATHIIAKIRKP